MKTRLTMLLCTLAIMLGITACTAVPRTLVYDMGERGESHRHAASHTYRISAGGTGSGWAWDHDTIVTNRHVVIGESNVIVSQGRQVWFVSHVEFIDGMDVALIDVIGPPLNVPVIRVFGPKIGESVTMSGHPHGTPDVIVTWGHVAGRWFWRDIAVDGSIIPGMSGGPVMDTEGRVIGMNVATTTPPGRALGIIIDIENIIPGVANDRPDIVEPPVPSPEGSPLGCGG